ncbi:hypothetical protein D9758_006625 [Tetrapyrgos nigripes]|uniref:DUF6532 domain-containing protein n=1 Tax=Tetrapyrgos nigripes TaxID=182062 RepID=A0A8H5GJ77_9AGAR|nr:hypothetical protein D9758_006625 [Tetrapyrgos nigripes]
MTPKSLADVLAISTRTNQSNMTSAEPGHADAPKEERALRKRPITENDGTSNSKKQKKNNAKKRPKEKAISTIKEDKKKVTKHDLRNDDAEMDDPEELDASDYEQPANVDEDSSAAEEDEEEDIDEEELAQERVQVVSSEAKKDNTTVNKAISKHGNFDFVAPRTQKAQADLDTHFPGTEDKLDEEGSSVENVEHPKPSARDKKYNDEENLAEEPQRPVFQGSESQERPSKPSKNAKSAASKRVTIDVAQIAAADTQNQNWPVEAHLFYPESGQRYIPLLKQPQHLRLVISETTNISIGIMLFQDACPKSEDQNNYVMLAFKTACNKHDKPLIADRFDRDDKFKQYIIAYINNRVSTIRGRVKESAQNIVPARYDLLKLDETGRSKLVKDLLKACCYIFPLGDSMNTKTWRSNEPYQHPAVVDILKDAFWTDSANHVSLGKKYTETFSSTVDDDSAKEVPKAMLGLIGIAIFAALREYTTGTRVKQNFDLSIMRDEYLRHIRFIEQKIIKDDGSGRKKYHNMAAKLYQQVTKSGEAANEDELPDVDWDNMA